MTLRSEDWLLRLLAQVFGQRREKMTIVNRRTFVAGRGHMDEMIEMINAIRDPELVDRLYRPHYAPFDVVAIELEFDSMAEMEAFWGEWEKSEEAATFMKRWIEITEPGGENQVWILE